MSRSILLQLTRDSIAEVLEAQRTIDKNELLTNYPLLNEPIATEVNIYLDGELRGSSKTDKATESLLEDLIKNAKRCCFEDQNFTPISTSEYLSCEIEVLLDTPDGVISEKDDPILEE